MVKAKKKTIKRERLDEPEPAPRAVQKPQPEIHTPEKYGARPSKATTCASCGHSYLKPCNKDPKRLANCGNWSFLQSKAKAKKK